MTGRSTGNARAVADRSCQCRSTAAVESDLQRPAERIAAGAAERRRTGAPLDHSDPRQSEIGLRSEGSFRRLEPASAAQPSHRGYCLLPKGVVGRRSIAKRAVRPGIGDNP